MPKWMVFSLAGPKPPQDVTISLQVDKVLAFQDDPTDALSTFVLLGKEWMKLDIEPRAFARLLDAEWLDPECEEPANG